MTNGPMRWHETAKRLVDEAGIPRTALMTALGVRTPAAVSHYLNGRRQPSPDQLKALADALGVRIDDFFGAGPTSRAPSAALAERLRAHSGRPSTISALRRRYAWSNPEGVAETVLIRNVLAAGRFDDILALATAFGLDRIEAIAGNDADLAARPRLTRLLGNIRAGYERARSHAS